EKLIEDLREYRTLSEYAVRKIRDWKEDKAKEEIEKLMEEIGPDFLEKTLREVEGAYDVIVAVENRLVGEPNYEQFLTQRED
ncbi:MAG: hypothetical protein N3C57_05385, partial [Aquificaceae bacterium]|nr:hypothetical protein [Aquificaceae bacterium]